jgi:CHAT domain-containing protein/predicted negative regulator of RcsB-dependent stress response
VAGAAQWLSACRPVIAGLLLVAAGPLSGQQNASPFEPRAIQQLQRWLAPERQAGISGDFNEALRLVDRALGEARQGLSEAHGSVAILLNDRGRWLAALGQLDEAAESARTAMAIWRGVQVASADRARHAEQFAVLARDAAMLLFAAGSCEASRAALSDAVASVEQLPTSTLRSEMAVDYARLLWNMGDAQAARQIVGALSHEESTEEARLLLASMNSEAHAFEAARRMLDQVRSGRGWGEDPATWSDEYLDAELAYRIESSELELALRLADDAIARARATNDAGYASAARHRRGQVLSLMGRFAEAAREYQGAIEVRGPAASASPQLAPIYHDLSWSYRVVGDLSRSAFYMDRALALSAGCSVEADANRALMRRERAMLLLDQGRIEEASAEVQEVLDSLATESTDTRVIRGLLLATRSFAEEREGQLASAEASMRDALGLIREAEGDASLNLPVGQIHLANVMYQRGQFDAVISQAGEALAILERGGARSVWGTGAAFSLRAAAKLRSGRLAEAWGDIDRLTDVVHQQAATASALAGAIGESETLQARRHVERILDALPSGSTDAARVARLLQLPHLSDAATSLQVSALDAMQLPGAVRRLVRQRSELLEKVLAARNELAIAERRGGQADPQVIKRLDQSLAELRAVDAVLVTESPRLAGQFLQQPVDPALVQKILKDDEAAMLFVVTPARVHGLLITPTRIVHRSTEMPRRQLSYRVSMLRRALDPGTAAGDRVAFDSQSAHEVYRVTLGMFEADLGSAKTLIVVPDGALHGIPFQVMVSKVDARGRAAEFVVERHAVGTMPSLQSLLSLRGMPARDHGLGERGFLAFADPDMSSFARVAQSERAARFNVIAANFDPLPESRREVETMAAALGGAGGSLWVGSEATEVRLKSMDLTGYGIVSFATHGLMAGELEGMPEPALVLTHATIDPGNDGLLTASEIAALDLRADLVILSACNTGRVSGDENVRGLSGLARGFFAAGARALVASHWYVDSDATVKLLTRMGAALALDDRLGPSDALREAMLWMLRGQAGEAFRSPTYWGAFAVVGDPA